MTGLKAGARIAVLHPGLEAAFQPRKNRDRARSKRRALLLRGIREGVFDDVEDEVSAIRAHDQSGHHLVADPCGDVAIANDSPRVAPAKRSEPEFRTFILSLESLPSRRKFDESHGSHRSAGLVVSRSVCVASVVGADSFAVRTGIASSASQKSRTFT